MDLNKKLSRIEMLRLSAKRILKTKSIDQKNLPANKKFKFVNNFKKTLLYSSMIILFLLFILNINFLYFLTNPYGYEKEVYPKLEILFNKNYSRINTVLKYSRLHKFPPLLTTAIIYAESSNDVYSLSHVKARGLMQVREETGFDAALMYAKKPLLAKTIKIYPDILYYPELNIYLSTLYIKTFKDLYCWNWQDALHAYNVGPNAFLKGKRHYYYVNRIMRFYNNWTKLNPYDIKRIYYNELYSIFGKKLVN